jgi:hypothetical protein
VQVQRLRVDGESLNVYEAAAGRVASEFALNWRVMRPRRNNAGPGRVYGQAWRGTLRFEAPRPNTARNLMMWLHEAAHVVGPFFGDDPLTVYAAEVKAYAWAFRTYRKMLGERAPERLRRWAKRQLEGQHWLAIDAAFALVE